MSHAILKDYVCPRCGWTVTPPIDHECDPFICKQCNGTGKVFAFRSMAECSGCRGTGAWRPSPITDCDCKLCKERKKNA